MRVRRGGEAIDISARETIVSMGALHSPAFLMRNGIGPAKELAALGIDVVADRAGVGKHLMEHPGVNFGCYLNPEARLAPDVRRQMFAGLRWSSKLEDCPAGRHVHHPEQQGGVARHRPPARPAHDVGQPLVSPPARCGSPRPIRSAKPDVDFNMCSDWRDMERMILGVRMMIKLQAHPAVQRTCAQIFPVSYSDRARRYAVYSRAERVPDGGRRRADGFRARRCAAS